MTTGLITTTGKGLGIISTEVGYTQMLDHLETCKSSPDLKRFLETGKTDRPQVVAQQAHICGSHAEQEPRECFMAIAKILKNAKGTILVE